jgi:hypothetical protein
MDDLFIDVTNEESFAYSSGFTTTGRKIRSWRERIAVLLERGFISVPPNGSWKFGYILLRHPHRAVLELKVKKKISDPWWGAFSKRASEVGPELPTALIKTSQFGSRLGDQANPHYGLLVSGLKLVNKHYRMLKIRKGRSPWTDQDAFTCCFTCFIL